MLTQQRIQNFIEHINNPDNLNALETLFAFMLIFHICFKLPAIIRLLQSIPHRIRAKKLDPNPCFECRDINTKHQCTHCSLVVTDKVHNPRPEPCEAHRTPFACKNCNDASEYCANQSKP